LETSESCMLSGIDDLLASRSLKST
jgi:hypothetical protein